MMYGYLYSTISQAVLLGIMGTVSLRMVVSFWCLTLSECNVCRPLSSLRVRWSSWHTWKPRSQR